MLPSVQTLPSLHPSMGSVGSRLRGPEPLGLCPFEHTHFITGCLVCPRTSGSYVPRTLGASVYSDALLHTGPKLPISESKELVHRKIPGMTFCRTVWRPLWPKHHHSLEPLGPSRALSPGQSICGRHRDCFRAHFRVTPQAAAANRGKASKTQACRHRPEQNKTSSAW